MGRRRPDVGWAHSPSGAEGPWGSGPKQLAPPARLGVGAGVGVGYLTGARRRPVPGARAEAGWACAQALPPARASGNPKGAPLTPPPRCLLPQPISLGGVLTPADAEEPAAEPGPTS